MPNTILQWKALEYEHHQKGFGWYLTFVIVAALLIFYEVFIHDYFAAVTFLIIAVIAGIFAGIPPKEVEITITDKGINIEDVHIPYGALKRFWIVDHARARALHLETTAYLNRFLIIQLNELDPEEIRGILMNFVPEDVANHESVSQRLARRLRF